MWTIRFQTREDWREARDLRLTMLADTPIAFIEPLGEAQARSDDEWKSRHESHLGADSAAVAAIDEAGRWRGQMAVRIGDAPERRAWLLAVWVHPDFRGRELGLARRMLAQIEAWVRREGLHELWLEVHEDNARAIAFYEREGFARTGGRRPYPLDPSTDELEMRRAL